VPNFLMNTSLFVFSYAKSFYLSWKLGLVALPLLALLVIPGLMYGQILMGLASKLHTEYNKSGIIVEQALSSIRTVALGTALPNLKYFSEAFVATRRISEMIERVPDIDCDDNIGDVMEKVYGEKTVKEDDYRGCVSLSDLVIHMPTVGKDKDFTNMKIQFLTDNVENYLISVPAEEQTPVKMGMWVRKLVCLVPVQIAHAENNAMVVLKDGLQIPHDISYVDSVSLANSIRFGFYDVVLNNSKGEIKVISSMGKQSSGKSYLLNHLSGSLLDVAGGRCTDGVWMKITTDFEGLGSFERSEQEDMLLFVLNAAVSNLTIFNKKDFHLDKDTEFEFNRFQNGINLLKQDKKLFKGQFYIAIKDVDTSDIEDL
ncbi:hypothetical protein KI387_008854, partial [Taxus chinensis]